MIQNRLQSEEAQGSGPESGQGSGQILQFRLHPRRAASAPTHLPRASAAAGDAGPSDDDLARYEQEDLHINYRHRMLMNVMAVVIVAALVGAGVWIADIIEDMQKAQDCLMQGRQNCAPIELPGKR